MQHTITIDTGTTNTRVILWNENQEQVTSSSAEIGVRNTAIDGNNRRLKEAVHNCLGKVIEAAGITYEHVQSIIASGMITSNVGLVEIPHLIAPAGLEQLAEGVRSILLPEVCPMPILFIPGIKNAMEKIDGDNFEQMDIMRGEEVEAYAILEDYPRNVPYLLVLPGSHTKFIAVDREGKVTGCLTTITGELLSSITYNTIIADAVGREMVDNDSYNKEAVLKGFKIAKRTGIARACFSARIMNQFVESDKQKVANYCLGAAIAGDIAAAKGTEAIKVSADAVVIVGGKNPLRQGIIDVLNEDGYFENIVEHVSAADKPLSAVGAMRIVNRRREGGEI